AVESREAFRKAAALHDAGQFAQAEIVLREATAKDPGNSDLWNARGVMFAGMKNPVNAIWCYREALAANPNGSGIWTNLGNALTTLKHLKSAISCHRRALALSRVDDALLHHNLGTSLAEAGFHGEAVMEFSRALQIKPDYHSARWDRALNYLHIGNYS